VSSSIFRSEYEQVKSLPTEIPAKGVLTQVNAATTLDSIDWIEMIAAALLVVLNGSHPANA
jgi:hypothetical protein